MAHKQVLFLDDDHKRIDEIRRRLEPAPCELTIVETADECILRLAERSYDLVLLDHDLGGEIFCDSSREDCGMEVVRWLKKSRGDHRAFIVHTMNPVAAAAMYLELNALGYLVAQATFGSAPFYRHLYAMLGIDLPGKVERHKTIGERINEYLRSIRSGKG
jgi:CheY-like chemotaxis protein